jgi:hypothetical protein
MWEMLIRKRVLLNKPSYMVVKCSGRQISPKCKRCLVARAQRYRRYFAFRTGRAAWHKHCFRSRAWCELSAELWKAVVCGCRRSLRTGSPNWERNPAQHDRCSEQARLLAGSKPKPKQRFFVAFVGRPGILDCCYHRCNAPLSFRRIRTGSCMGEHQ